VSQFEWGKQPLRTIRRRAFLPLDLRPLTVTRSDILRVGVRRSWLAGRTPDLAQVFAAIPLHLVPSRHPGLTELAGSEPATTDCRAERNGGDAKVFGGLSESQEVFHGASLAPPVAPAPLAAEAGSRQAGRGAGGGESLAVGA
jgi:hypothetical protein